MTFHWWFDKDLLGGKKKSKAPPALAAFQDHAHMVHIGKSSNDLWHGRFDGHRWSTDIRIPVQKSKADSSRNTFIGFQP